MDATTKEIVAVEITESWVHNSLHLCEDLEQVEHPIGQVSGEHVTRHMVHELVTRGLRSE